MIIQRPTLLSLTAAWLLFNTTFAATTTTTTTSTSIIDNEQQQFGNQHIVKVVYDLHQKQQQPPSSTTSIDAFAMTNALSEYYENIVDQVMATLTEEITLSAPRSYMSIHHYGTVRRGRCRTSLRSFVHDLRDHLNLMRANLLGSIRPLVESNLPSVLPYTQSPEQQQQQRRWRQNSNNNNNNDDDDKDITVIGARLTEDILALNRHICLQLGLILNVEEAADIIINQSMPTRVLLLEDATHHRDISQHRTHSSSSFWNNYNNNHNNNHNNNNQQQLILLAATHKKSSPIYNNEVDDIDEMDEKEALAWLETLRRESEQQEEQRPESRALTHWLRSWLSEVEEILKVQFDERVQDATQLILEDFLVDDS